MSILQNVLLHISMLTAKQFLTFCESLPKHIAKSFCSPLSSLRYRHEFKSNELWSEIKLVLDTFALPLTELFKVCIDIKIHISKANGYHIVFNDWWHVNSSFLALFCCRLLLSCVKLMLQTLMPWRSSSLPSHSFPSCSTVLIFR